MMQGMPVKGWGQLKLCRGEKKGTKKEKRWVPRLSVKNDSNVKEGLKHTHSKMRYKGKKDLLAQKGSLSLYKP